MGFRLCDILRHLAKDPPTEDAERKELYNAAVELMYSVESAQDTAQRLYHGHIPLALAQMGIDLKIFNLLAQEPDTKWTATQLAFSTGANSVLLHRILRCLASYGMIAETMDGHYKASNITTNLTLPGTHAGIKHYSLTMTPAYNAIPKFFASNRYEQPGKKTPFNLAFNTDLPVFEWRQHNPENAEAGQEFMKHQRIGQTSVWEKGVCLDDFVLSPIDVQNERVLLVDVGGGRGHQCVDLRTKRPDIKGHMITQDLPFCHDMIPNKDDLEAMDIEIMSHDFMTPQPVKGAKIYYLRNVIHNWPDEQATVILSHIKAAMAEDSVLILDDVVMPTVGATWKQTSMDVAMMTMLAAMERTEEQFQHLLEGVGLQITNIWTYDDEYGDSLLFIGAL